MTRTCMSPGVLGRKLYTVGIKAHCDELLAAVGQLFAEWLKYRMSQQACHHNGKQYGIIRQLPNMTLQSLEEATRMIAHIVLLR